MKCVCPMGGDRTCPDDCPLAVWQSLSSDDRKAKRKPIAERLYRQGFTMEAIATQLGVSQRTISEDLRNLEVASKLKPAKTDANPKGAGRPKGARPKPKSHDQVVALADSGISKKDIASKTGLGERMVDRVLEVENARREGRADPVIDRSSLSMSAQQKLDAAIRQHKHTVELQFESKVRNDVKKRIDEIVLPHWKEQIAQAQMLYERRRALMDKKTFNKIRRALHPDSRNSVSDEVLREAFNAFMALEKFLLDEKDSPTAFHDVPDNLAEWDRMRAQTTAERRARRGRGESSSLRRA